jgi:predicted kinase
VTQPVLLIITGAPGTGKTVLSRRIAAHLALPCLRKDDIKERLFDTLGWSDRDWSRKLGVATYALLYYCLELQLQAGQPLIVECNFSRERDSAPVRTLLDRYSYAPFQILCWASGPVLLERFRQRATAPERHPGHVDQQAYAELEPLLREGRIDPLAIGGPVYELDTSDFAAIDYQRLFAALPLASKDGPLGV